MTVELYTGDGVV